jgi:hypothetical protein
MKFLLQVRFNGADKVIGALPAEEQKKVTAEFEAIRQSLGVLDGNQLQPASEAATVRVKEKFPAPAEGIVLSHFIVASDVGRSRRFYAGVLGGEVLRDGEPSTVALASSWIIINAGGPLADD